MREMKDSGIEWIGEIPENWKISKIDNVYTPRNTKVSDIDYPPLSVTMQGIVPQLESAAKTNAHDSRKLVRKGDFAINSRSDRRGSCGISEYTGSVSLINTVLKPTENMIPGYFNWLFHTTSFADEFYKWGHGIVDDLWSTGWQEMRKISIPYPELSEQQKIADFLDKKCSEIDALSTDIQTQIDTLEEYKKSIITEAVTKGLNPNVEMKYVSNKWLEQIPKHWEFGRIKNVISVLTDYTANGSFADLAKNVAYLDYDGFARLVRLTDLRCDLNNIDKVFVSEDSYNYLSKSKLFGNEILIANVGAYSGLFCLMPSNKGICTLGPNMFLLRTNFRMSYKYLYYLGHAKPVEEQLNQKSQATAQPKLNKTDVKSVYICIPNIKEQQEISDFLDKKSFEIEKAISEKQQQLETLEEYKKSLIYEYVTGKKEIA